MITRTGWPASPPRLLTSATQARMAGGAGPEMVPLDEWFESLLPLHPEDRPRRNAAAQARLAGAAPA